MNVPCAAINIFYVNLDAVQLTADSVIFLQECLDPILYYHYSLIVIHIVFYQSMHNLGHHIQAKVTGTYRAIIKLCLQLGCQFRNTGFAVTVSNANPGNRGYSLTGSEGFCVEAEFLIDVGRRIPSRFFVQHVKRLYADLTGCRNFFCVGIATVYTQIVSSPTRLSASGLLTIHMNKLVVAGGRNGYFSRVGRTACAILIGFPAVLTTGRCFGFCLYNSVFTLNRDLYHSRVITCITELVSFPADFAAGGSTGRNLFQGVFTGSGNGYLSAVGAVNTVIVGFPAVLDTGRILGLHRFKFVFCSRCRNCRLGASAQTLYSTVSRRTLMNNFEGGDFVRLLHLIARLYAKGTGIISIQFTIATPTRAVVTDQLGSATKYRFIVTSRFCDRYIRIIKNDGSVGRYCGYRTTFQYNIRTMLNNDTGSRTGNGRSRLLAGTQSSTLIATVNIHIRAIDNNAANVHNSGNSALFIRIILITEGIIYLNSGV